MTDCRQLIGNVSLLPWCVWLLEYHDSLQSNLIGDMGHRFCCALEGEEFSDERPRVNPPAGQQA